MDKNYYKNQRREVYEMVPSSVARVLEIGCAEGEFKTNFPRDVEYWGVEPVSEVADHALRKGIHVLCGTYEDMCSKIPDGYFDVVVCNDVIEHMLDPENFLVSVKNKLTANGVLVGSIPNVRFWGNLIKLLIKRDWKYEDSGVLDKTHLRFFTGKSFRRLLNKTGYEIVQMKGIESQRMKILKVLFFPFLALAGFDVCHMQIMFKVVKSEHAR